eukprot:scaffold20528_cov132-Isochrysis_galbana.AAC.2
MLDAGRYQPRSLLVLSTDFPRSLTAKSHSRARTRHAHGYFIVTTPSYPTPPRSSPGRSRKPELAEQLLVALHVGQPLLLKIAQLLLLLALSRWWRPAQPGTGKGRARHVPVGRDVVGACLAAPLRREHPDQP